MSRNCCLCSPIYRVTTKSAHQKASISNKVVLKFLYARICSNSFGRHFIVMGAFNKVLRKIYKKKKKKKKKKKSFHRVKIVKKKSLLYQIPESLILASTIHNSAH